MKAMLLAAGFGTRLKPFTDKHPKALAIVNDKTLLELNLHYLQRFGINDVIVNVHHFADQIEAAIRDGQGFGSNVTVSDERGEVLETGGGLLKAAHYFEGEDDFVVMNVDVLTNLDLAFFIEAHRTMDAAATLAVMDRPSSRGLLFDRNNRLSGWQNNATGEQRIAREGSERLFAFSGIQIISAPLLAGMSRSGKFSLIDVYLDAAADQYIFGHNHTGDVFIDVGKPESLEKAAALFQ